MKMEQLENKMCYLFGGTVIVFCLSYTIVFQQADYGDYVTHAEWAMELNRHIFNYMAACNPYPLWHIVVKIFYRLGYELSVCIAGVTALFNCLAFGGIVYAWDFISNKQTALRTKVFWAICILLMGPLYAPSFNDKYYLGQGTGNIWHNPTQIAVKGFAILCFVWIVRLVNQEVDHRKWEYFVLSGLLFLSVLAKPSFLQAMIPGLGLFFIYELLRNRGNKERFVHYCRIAATFIPGVILMGAQFIIVYFIPSISMYGEREVVVSYGSVLSLWTDNIFISLLLSLAFPIFVMLIGAKRLFKDSTVMITVFYGLCAWLEAVFLYESGPAKKQGNWTWGWNLSLLIIWMQFIIKYLDILRDESLTTRKRAVCLWLGMPILFFHVLFGINYAVLLAQGAIVY